MTDVLQLDLSATDEGLLVPFGRKMENLDAVRDDPNPLFAPPPPTKRSRWLFRRSSRDEEKQQEEENKHTPLNEHPFVEEGPAQRETLIEKKQASTFSFPNAPHEYAAEDEDEARNSSAGNVPSKSDTQETKPETSDEDSSNSEKEESENEEESPEAEKQDTSTPLQKAPPSHWRQRQDGTLQSSDKTPLAEAEPKRPMEGYGNSKPEDDDAFAVGRFFRRLSRKGEMIHRRHFDMKSMKIATEDTKDEKTLGERVTHCFQVALAPEIYAEDVEGEGNLGFYRPIRPNPLSGEEQALSVMAKWKALALQLTARVKDLKGKVEKLEEELKTKDLEAMTWKHRAKELQEQLRKYEHDADDDDDDGSVGPWKKYENRKCESSESEIDHKWTEEHDAAAAKEDAIQIKGQPGSTVKEDILLDTEIAPDKIEFDPIAAKKKEIGKLSKDNSSEQRSGVEKDGNIVGEKQNLLVAKEVEKAEFNPSKANETEDSGAQLKAPTRESEDLLELIESLGSEEAQKSTTDESAAQENKEENLETTKVPASKPSPVIARV